MSDDKKLDDIRIGIIGPDGKETGETSLSELKANIQARLAETTDQPRNMIADGWSGELYGFCPVQGEGQVDGLRWYFRARYDAWSFHVSKLGQSVADDLWEDVFFYEEDYGDDIASASWMPYPDAWRCVGEAIEKFRARPPL